MTPARLGKVLIANRGEIAVRVIRGCQELSIPTVAVYSEADAGAPHALIADEAIAIGPSEAAQSYLNVEALLAAAKATGATAVHPGYGFLAESAGFARACADAGLTFIGPSPDVIDRLGDKRAARRLADEAEVPTVPGGELPADDAAAEARAIEVAASAGFPLLLKAVAGGGGKGMRVVRSPDELRGALAGARHEASSAFSNDALLVEKYVERSRHIEVQILGDAHGNLVHLGERECSIQRRHQKIIEESPSPAVDAARRAQFGDAALRIARAVNYVNAGTVEFLLDDETGAFYFLEVNTRLQVEHPVTEVVTGVDLVHQQLHVAAGAELNLSASAGEPRGHALECRVYAEDPAADFAPSPGRIALLSEPQRPGLRIDSGVRAGQTVPVFYDPILSKIITWGPDRPGAIARMQRALHDYVLLGCGTNLDYLRDVVAHPAFAAAELTTGFLQEHFAGWRAPEPDATVDALAAAIANRRAAASADASTPRGPVASPWTQLDGWRMG